MTLVVWRHPKPHAVAGLCLGRADARVDARKAKRLAHRSDEAGHGLMLAHLRAEPLLQLGLRLGEGSGAALAWPLIASSVKLLDEMASFGSAGVSTRSDG